MKAMIRLLLIAAIALAGCVPSEPMAPGEMDRLWVLHPAREPSEEAAPTDEAGAEAPTIPTRWTLRREESLVWSTVSIVRASDRLKAGGIDEIEFGIADEYADQLVETLAETRAMLQQLKEISEMTGPDDRRQWADRIARMVVRTEQIVRLISTDDAGRPRSDSDDATGTPGGPVLQMIVMYLNEQTGGELLGEMDLREAASLREALAQVVLRLSFAFAAKQEPAGLAAEMAELMVTTTDLSELEEAAHQKLLAAIKAAPPGAADSQLAGAFAAALTVGPKACEVLEALASQWDRMESVTVDVRPVPGESVVEVTLSVQPGKEVTLEGMVIAQPVIAFRRTSKVTIVSSSAPTDDVIVSFESVDDGSVEIRFEGLPYAIVRLVAIPLVSARLREIRVYTGSGHEGRSLVNVAVLMEATAATGDPRRLMVFQDVRQEKLVREAFDLRTEQVARRQVFSYLTPDRRYTYHRMPLGE